MSTDVNPDLASSQGGAKPKSDGPNNQRDHRSGSSGSRGPGNNLRGRGGGNGFHRGNGGHGPMGGRGGARGGGRGGGFGSRDGSQQRDGGGRGGGGGSGRGNIGGSGGRGRGGGERGTGGPSGQMNSMGGGRNFERFDRVLDKLQAIQGLPTLDLPQIDFVEKRFNGRSRLYVGNFTSDMTEAQLKEILSQYGEVGEMFYNKEKMFAFLRMGSRLEAEKAKRELDGQMRNGRPLKVRFAPHQGAIKVLNLGPMVSNELLHRAFSIFGDIERCLVLSDDRGRPKGEGMIEFERKPAALEAIKRCNEGCFFLTSSLRPVIAELIEENEDDDGMQEKMLPKRNNEYHKEREMGPRFATPNTFEFEYGNKWKALYDMKKQKLEALDREMKLEEDKLFAQMDYARYEHETEGLREQLRQREAARDQQKSAWENKEREMEEMMKQEHDRRKREEEGIMNRMQQQDVNMRQKQQENSLFMQAQELNQMLDRQEASMNQNMPDMQRNQGGPGGPRHNGPPMGGEGFSGFSDFGHGAPNTGFGGPNFGGGPRGGNGYDEEFFIGEGSGFGNFGGNGGGRGRWNNQNDGPGGKRRRY